MSFIKSSKILTFNCLSTDLIEGLPPITINNIPISENSICYVFNVTSNIIDRTFMLINGEWRIKDVWGGSSGKIINSLGNEINLINSIETGYKVDIVNDYDNNSSLQLVPNLGGVDGFTSQGIVTITENILTPLNSVINLNTLYYPTSPQKVFIASTSVLDDILSTGATSIVIGGLDANYDYIDEVILLDGQTPVESTLNYIRVNYAFVASFGSVTPFHGKQWSVGNIYVGGNSVFTTGVPSLPIIGINGANTNTFLKEIANRESIFTIPDGFFWMLKDYEVNTESAKEVRVSICFRFYGETFFRMISPVTILGGSNRLSLIRKFGMPPRTDVQLRLKTTGGESFTNTNIVGDLFSIE